MGVLLSATTSSTATSTTRVVFDGERVEIGDAALAFVDERRRALLAFLERGGSAYGVTTGLGYLTTRASAGGSARSARS